MARTIIVVHCQNDIKGSSSNEN